MTNIMQFIFQALLQLLNLQTGWSQEIEPLVEQVAQPVTHAEGPHWDIESQSLFYVDIEGELVNRYDPATGEVTHARLVGGGVSLVIPLEGSGGHKLIVTRGHDVLILDWNHENATFENTTSSENITLITSVETGCELLYGNRWNDGKADARGRLWAGTMGLEKPVGHVFPQRGGFYRLNPNARSAKLEVTPIGISNGLAWNEDNTLLYYIDTATLQVDVFDFDLEGGSISNRRKVFNLTENNVPGFPDGMTIDNNGNLWIACFFGGRVINVDPRTGELLRTVEIPAKRVCSVIFGGPNLDVLYVATSRYGLTERELEEEPLAGSVFAVFNLGVKALAPGHNVLRDF